MFSRVMVRRIRGLANHFGFEILRLTKDRTIGPHPVGEIAKVLTKPDPLFFDVGANVGEFCRELKAFYPASRIHCFEPSPQVYRKLEQALRVEPNVVMNNIGLGDKPGELVLVEYGASVLSSFLEPGYLGDKIEQRTPVEVSTVDAYCAKMGIDYIDALKVDTQGFDYQVLVGSSGMLSRGRIQFVLCEITLDEMYIGIERLDRVLTLMFDHGYALYGIYNMYHRDQKLSWADFVFVRS